MNVFLFFSNMKSYLNSWTQCSNKVGWLLTSCLFDSFLSIFTIIVILVVIVVVIKIQFDIDRIRLVRKGLVGNVLTVANIFAPSFLDVKPGIDIGAPNKGS